MWPVFILLHLGVLYCTVSSSPPSPFNVVFSSVNLQNVLQWSLGNDTPDDTHFTVQYAIYGDSVEGSKGRRVHWRAVRQCTEIVRSWCDLSNETWDLDQGYHARVRAVSRRASSKWALTHRRFDPRLDTSFGPPLVSVFMEANSAIITLKGPMRYQPNNNTPAVSMASLYTQMTYNLSILNTRRGQTSHFPGVSSRYKYRLMEYNTEYCFSARARFLSMPIQCQSSVWHCLTTPPDPVIGQLQRVVVGIVVPSVCMCMLVAAGYLLYHYLTGKGQKSPYILNPPSFHSPPLTLPPENLNVLLITVIKDEPSGTKTGTSGPDCPKWQRDLADPPPEYFPQRSETPPEPEEPWDALSDYDYGFIGVAPKIDVRGEEDGREGRHDGGGDGNDVNKEWRVEGGRSSGVYASQAKSYFSQKSTHTFSQTHMSIPTQAEMSMPAQAHACAQLNSVLLAQAPSLSLQGEAQGELARENPSSFIKKTPQTCLFPVPLDLQTKKGRGMGEEMDGKARLRTDGKTDGAVDEGGESERVPLLSAYVSQNSKDMHPSHANRSDYLPDDYAVLTLAMEEKIEECDEEEEEGENRTICIDWDLMTRKLVLPEMVMEFNKEGGMDGLMQGEKGRKTRVEGEEEEEEVKGMKGELRLENVFVRQGSEEDAEAQREMEGGGETGCEVDDILTKWNLVITMNE